VRFSCAAKYRYSWKSISNSTMQLLFLLFCSIPVVYFGLKRFDFDFVENGILPRTLLGLQGVFLVRLFMLIWSIFITIQSFTYFIALQFFSTQIKP
jgi:hypothetical protein